MACGCIDSSCGCVVTAGTGITVTGSGSSGNPYIISSSGSETPFAATSSNDAIFITPGGTNGHTPDFEFVLDPSTDPGCAQITGDGLFIDCGAGAGSSVPVSIVVVNTVVGTGNQVVLADTDGGILTVTLPPAPAVDQRVEIKNYGSSGNLLTIDPTPNDVDNVAGSYTRLDLESDTLV